MPLQINATRAVLEGVSVQLDAFTDLAQTHLQHVASTRELEEAARRLAADRLPSTELQDFIRSVCRWGGWAGIAGRVMRDNAPDNLREAFAHAMTSVATTPADALRSINRIRGLGQPSYASKHLRFIAPEHCGVLDSLVATRLGYDYDADGYGVLSEDLRHLRRRLGTRGVENPMRRRGGSWWAADVDMAIFAWLRIRDGAWT